MNDRDATSKPHGSARGRSRTSAVAGSRIRFRDHELMVVEIGPFAHAQGATVTFRARSVGAQAVRVGAIIKTRWGVCEVVA
ncbi:hypothetical protein [Paraburkholderia fungorum]|uniref:PilZ domain-containing protein n=1 Tax=Paraburkholderia fungorum TaxID=134537 RepID=A0AAW3UVD5_9BURK|nr:hypothetical protein [Paraburkholderia fungorum]MBB4514585.1 hypothetical protein [Paraburkholderia fungorum]MBB6202528.1 hypothetical protein [Paraburkholderia fungorum]MDE1012391.1 hypothetical protein [Paraburkholderia fungorum]USX07210.1 hypothetical protein NHH62_31775 [Paraburkholderia fungorum]